MNHDVNLNQFSKYISLVFDTGKFQSKENDSKSPQFFILIWNDQSEIDELYFSCELYKFNVSISSFTGYNDLIRMYTEHFDQVSLKIINLI